MTGTLAPPGTRGPTVPGAAEAVPAGTTRWWVLAWWVALVACTALTVVWLALGAVVALAAHVPAVGAAVAAAAGAGGRWSGGVLEAAGLGEPGMQALLDYAASLVNLVVAVVLWRRGGRSWTVRLLVLAMIGSAGAFNLQAHAATLVVRRGSGVGIGELHQILLHGVASAAYVGALLLFPTGVAAARGGRRVLLGLAGVVLFAAGVGTALLPHTVSCVVFFGFGVPLVGALGVARHLRAGATPERRAQARLLVTVLTGALAAASVLALLTAVLAALGQPGVTLDDPTARHGGHGEPTALLFWFTRLTAAALALAVLAAYRPRLRAAADRLHGALTAVVVVVAVGGAFALVAALAGSGPVAYALAAVVAAGVYLAVSARADRRVERLLHGRRPTPYRVLLEIAELSRSAAPGSGLDRLPEAIGQHLGARTVELTAHRPGLRDRAYRWRRDPAGDAAELVAFPIRHHTEEIGVLAVDAEAVAGGTERRRLLDDVADSLGAVLQAHRLEIELERQLRAAVAHGEQIAESRRAAVAEMDGERRAIERNLHDGAQHHLVSLRLSLGLVEHQLGAGRLEAARERLGELTGQVDTAEAVLAETATGVSSANLAERGVVESLRHDVAGADATITVDVTGVLPGRRWASDVESAVYFCCLEAVNNARKHAPGAPITVTLTETGGVLRFAVRDEGPGFDPGPASAGPGRGMRNVTTRISAVGGSVALHSAPGRGTTVEGSIPLSADHLAPPATPGSPDIPGIPNTPDSPDTPGTSTGPSLPSPSPLPALDGSAPGPDPEDDPNTGPVVLPPPAEAGARDAWGASAAARAPLGLPRAVQELVDELDPPEPAAARVGEIAAALAVPPEPGRDPARAAVVRAQRALDALEALARSGEGGHDWAWRLLYQVERVRLAGAREVAESDLAEALRCRVVVLPEGEQRAAERLIGAAGWEPATRLGLAPDAPPEQIRRAAHEQLADWRARAGHPASSRAVRDAALVLAGVCEGVLADTAPVPPR